MVQSTIQETAAANIIKPVGTERVLFLNTDDASYMYCKDAAGVVLPITTEGGEKIKCLAVPAP